MAFISVAKFLVIFQLCLLVCSSITGGYGDETPAALHPPPPPVEPPTYPPPLVKPPPTKRVAGQGVVYCKSCKYRGIDNLNAAAPLAGAVVKLQCNIDKKHTFVEKAKTDKNGYFFLMPHEKLTASDAHKCKVLLVSSPLPKCSVPTNLHGGTVGAILIPTPTRPTLPFELFNVGPFAFEPPKKLPCHY